MPGVCSSIWTSSDSGAEAKTIASMRPSSRPTTAGVCGSRTSVIVAGSIRFASISRRIRLGTPLPGSPMLTRQPASCARLVSSGALSSRCGRVAAIEQPDRLVEQAAERDQAVVVGVAVVARRRPVVVGAALHEGDVDLAAGLAQEGDVLGRAGGLPQAHLDAVLLQDLRVALAELGVGALVLAGRENDPARRRRVEQPVGDGEQADGEEDERQRRRDQVAE